MSWPRLGTLVAEPGPRRPPAVPPQPGPASRQPASSTVPASTSRRLGSGLTTLTSAITWRVRRSAAAAAPATLGLSPRGQEEPAQAGCAASRAAPARCAASQAASTRLGAPVASTSRRVYGRLARLSRPGLRGQDRLETCPGYRRELARWLGETVPRAKPRGRHAGQACRSPSAAPAGRVLPRPDPPGRAERRAQGIRPAAPPLLDPLRDQRLIGPSFAAQLRGLPL